MDRNLQLALAKFRQPRPLTTLQKILDPDITSNIRTFLERDSPKQHFQLVLVFIKHHHCRPLKRCTPCHRCGVVRTYRKNCDTCDAELWLEIT
jgi:hypothetical protein